jgi:hypothetical protein
MAAEPKPWKPGDRVIVRLPDRNLRQGGKGFRQVDVHGTVRAVDLPGQPPGVKVDLDREINGVRDCYATHRELRPEVPGG